jgi:hypothetical protein
VQFLNITIIDEQFEILADAADTKAVIALKYECVLPCSNQIDLLFVANWAGLLASGLRIFLFFLKHLPLHLKRKGFVPLLKLCKSVNRRPPLDQNG